MADRVAAFGGSWTFIGLFLGMMVVWMIINIFEHTPFDPYPFILLNLCLSCLAALQAPVIMMSQNRQSLKDRLDASHDYEVNLKAETEIVSLHLKMDELRERQWASLMEIQQRASSSCSATTSRRSSKRLSTADATRAARTTRRIAIRTRYQGRSSDAARNCMSGATARHAST